MSSQNENSRELSSDSGSSAPKKSPPAFRPGDTLKVHVRIIEGSKERIQVFEGVVTKRHKRTKPEATFTVRKVSYNIGVERTFFLHSPRIEKIEVVTKGKVRRARLFYLRTLRGKSSKIKSSYMSEAERNEGSGTQESPPTISKPDTKGALEPKKSNGGSSATDGSEESQELQTATQA